MEDWARPDRLREIHPGLIEMADRTVLTPHLGSAVDSVRRDIALSAARSVVDFLEGRRPRHAIDRSASLDGRAAHR